MWVWPVFSMCISLCHSFSLCLSFTLVFMMDSDRLTRGHKRGCFCCSSTSRLHKKDTCLNENTKKYCFSLSQISVLKSMLPPKLVEYDWSYWEWEVTFRQLLKSNLVWVLRIVPLYCRVPKCGMNESCHAEKYRYENVSQLSMTYKLQLCWKVQVLKSIS